MAQLVEALRYKSEGGGFDSRSCRWKLLLPLTLATLWTWGRLSH